MDAAGEIEVLIRARYPVLYLVSWEERRVEQALDSICKTLNRKLYVWSLTQGMKPEIRGSTGASQRLELEGLIQIHDAPDGSVVILKDFHAFMKDNTVVRLLRDLAEKLRGKAVTIVILAPMLQLPVELEKDITVIEFPLPGKSDIEAKLNDVIQTMKGNDKVDTTLSEEDRERIIKAGQGLTMDEIESCFARRSPYAHTAAAPKGRMLSGAISTYTAGWKSLLNSVFWRSPRVST